MGMQPAAPNADIQGAMLRSWSRAALVFPAALLAVECSAVAQTDAGLARFVHPSAKALISINWSRVAHSPIGTILRQRLGVDAGSVVPGIEFLDDVDRVLISSPGADPADAEAEAPLLVAVAGRFDLARVRVALLEHGTKPQLFNAYQVFRPQGKNARDIAFVLIDTHTILIGDSRSVFDTLERSAYAPPTPGAGSILGRAAALETNYDISLVVTSPSALGGGRIHDLLSGRGLDEPQGFEAGFWMRGGFTADIAVLFASDEVAKAMAANVSKMIKLASQDKANEALLQMFGKKVKFAAEGARLKISVRMTAQELDKMAQAMAAGLKQRAALAAAQASRSAAPIQVDPPAPPLPPEKQVIRIEGLDDGPREIPYHQH